MKKRILKKVPKNGLLIMLLGIFLFPVTVNAQDVDASKYYYNQLTENEKKIYNILNDDNLNTEPAFSVTLDTAMTNDEWELCFTRAQCALQADNPAYEAKRTLWYHNFLDDAETAQEKRYAMVTPMWEEDSYWVKKAEAKKDQIVATIGEGDRYTKLRKLYDYMHRNMLFAEEKDDETVETSVIKTKYLSCLLNGEGVCAGFATSFKYLCDAMNIPCIIVGNSTHAWNYIQMEDGKWYAIDMSAGVKNSGNYDWDTNLLMGSQTDTYIENSNYWTSDLYLGQPSDFSFPELNEVQYVYEGNNTDFSYTEAANHFVDGDCTISGHKWSYPEVRYNNCVQTGAFVFTCLECGEKKITENGWEIMDQHIEQKRIVVKEPTCQAGTYRDVCKICGAIVGEGEIPANGKHVEQKEITKQATCLEEGTAAITCKICKKVLRTEKIAKTAEHTYRETNDGFYKTKKCIICGKTGSKTKVTLASITIKKTIAKKKAIEVRWKKSKDKNIKYQLQYSTKSSFRGAKTINAKTATKKAITKLKSKKTYYVRVRTYRKGKSDGKTVTIYSKWSKAKKVKTK